MREHFEPRDVFDPDNADMMAARADGFFPTHSYPYQAQPKSSSNSGSGGILVDFFKKLTLKKLLIGIAIFTVASSILMVLAVIISLILF